MRALIPGLTHCVAGRFGMSLGGGPACSWTLFQSRSRISRLTLTNALPTYFRVPGSAIQGEGRLGCLDQIAVLGSPIKTSPGENANASALDDDLRAVAVEFGFMHPVVAFGRLGDQGRHHRRNELKPAGAGTYNFTHLFDSRRPAYISQSERNVIPLGCGNES
jgi:hypothetical protein